MWWASMLAPATSGSIGWNTKKLSRLISWTSAAPPNAAGLAGRELTDAGRRRRAGSCERRDQRVGSIRRHRNEQPAGGLGIGERRPYRARYVRLEFHSGLEVAFVAPRAARHDA